jgi:hypothetical protein
MPEEDIKKARVHVMDCMDCHNRPSHIFYSPDYAIDMAILTGKIDHSIPEIKRVAVEAVAATYETSEEAQHGIANFITDYYRRNHPDYYENNRVIIDDAVIAAQAAFNNNIFPTMKVRWSEYPENIGHFQYKGCMRCHEGNHESDKGIKITHKCNACHTILSQGSGDRAEVSTSHEGLTFSHPVDIDEAWKEIGCYECHNGVQP